MAKLKKKLAPELLYVESMDMHTLWDVRQNGRYINPRNLTLRVRFWNTLRVWIERKVQRLVMKVDICGCSASERKEMKGRFELICMQEDHTYKNSDLFEKNLTATQKDVVVDEADEKIIQPTLPYVGDSKQLKAAATEKPDSPVAHLPSNNSTVVRRYGRRADKPKPGEAVFVKDEAEFEKVVSSLKASGMTSVTSEDVAAIEQNDLDQSKH